MADDLASKFEAYLKSLSPAQSEKLHHEIVQSLKDDEELAAKIERCRVKGLKSKDAMIFQVNTETTCITCGNVVKGKTWSSSLQPIVVTLILCGRCADVLAQLSKEDLIQLIINKERAYYSRPKDYMPNYRMPILTKKQEEHAEEEIIRDIPDFMPGEDTTPANETPLFDGPEDQPFLDSMPTADEEVEE